MKYNNIREEELKNKVGADWFKNFDTTEIIGNIDFSVFPAQDNLFGRTPLLWAEAKKGDYDVVTMFVQLILTIGKARTFDKTLPPAFLGAFDFKKIAFVPYIAIQDIFYINDFNWNVTPSNHQSKEFLLIKERVEKSLKQNAYIYNYIDQEKELKFFIKNNIAKASQTAKIKIDKNNFVPIYLRWLEIIKPIIEVNWDELKKVNILDSDFYLADLFVDDKHTQTIEDDESIRENLFVIYQNQGYKIAKENLKQMFDATINIKNKEAYQAFWKIYKRPPLKEYQEYIIERRDLLVPQDIRERKGAFFTPRQWVELSQKYLTDYLGENWQDQYYIWDCAAGTGNLLAGLTNKFHIYASTLDQADVSVMHERVEHGANLLKKHCFQFDFLNDEFIPQSKGGKLPDSLYDIITNEEKRKKLVFYINPPYAESGNSKQKAGTGDNKANVSKDTKVYHKYKPLIKRAISELYAQFLIRIYKEIPQCKIAQFSTLKIVQSYSFSDFRKHYRAKLENFFSVPANTFDNVTGKFRIGFFIWNGEEDVIFTKATNFAYNRKSELQYLENIYPINSLSDLINHWIKQFVDKDISNSLGFLACPTADYQHNLETNIALTKGKGHIGFFNITKKNIIPVSIYFSVRLCIDANEDNDRNNFWNPDNNNWHSDTEFQSDCLAFTLFHGQNRITSIPLTPEGGTAPSPSERAGGEDSGVRGINHWIPFTEQEVNAPEPFASHFMTDFIKGKTIANSPELFSGKEVLILKEPLAFSEEATAVFNAGRELWRYYFTHPDANPNASLYDIREYFQGRNDKGRMNTKSTNEEYNQLIGNLREAVSVLAKKIEPKVYEYGFLRA